ncbi:hypothetical protein AWH56_002725 [Anaerobacillus isosaccharinicus]|uniref:Uncharacterized protein n=1 Tax=Anaerobacillus isosaccharinicus TaxID=1532552 RepID=A0A1S2MEA2_9BACI|nr:hypothetical protein [Anaerobacillus isosaccharinicus]MBA5585042.1 hypothetical protein [Anaerobacillus isosaccharinicus]QOY36609.1 hypothetical protein AWH56_002725 [Anaerobacillus isosaccharinicus]
MDFRSIEDVKHANLRKIAKEEQRKLPVFSFFYLIIVSLVVMELYWRHHESPLIVYTFIAFLLFFFSITIPLIIKLIKLKISKLFTTGIVLILTIATYYTSTLFL